MSIGAKEVLALVAGVLLLGYALIGFYSCDVYSPLLEGRRSFEIARIAGYAKDLLCFSYLVSAIGLLILVIPESLWVRRVSSSGYFERKAIATMLIGACIAGSIVVSLIPRHDLAQPRVDACLSRS